MRFDYTRINYRLPYDAGAYIASPHFLILQNSALPRNAAITRRDAKYSRPRALIISLMILQTSEIAARLM